MKQDRMNRSDKDLYKVLGLEKDASEQDIKKAFKKLAMKHHPDRGGDGEIFKQINEAYAVLSDPEKRANYDRFGTVDMSDMQMPNFDDLFENLFGFSFGANGPGGGGPFRRHHPMEKKSPDKEITIEATLEQVMTGSSIPYKLSRKIYKSEGNSSCMTCNGNGRVMQQMNLGLGIMTQNITTCPECKGIGVKLSDKNVVIQEEIFSIPIPQGIPRGNRMVIRGKGDQYPNSTPGDVIITVNYKKHIDFEPDPVNPQNIIHRMRCSLYECLFGFDRYIHLLDKKVLRVFHEPGRPIVSVMDGPINKIIKNRGFSFRGKTGDLHLHISIIMPIPSLKLKEVLQEHETQNAVGDEKWSDISINIASL